MTENQLEKYNEVYSKVKGLSLSVRELLFQLNSFQDEEIPFTLLVELSPVKLTPEIGEKCLELFNAYEELDEL